MIPRKMVLLLMILLLPTPYASAVGPASSPDGEAMLLPYLAVGGIGAGLHYETLLLVGNPTPELTSGVIDVYDENIEPLPIALNGDRGLMAEISWALPPGRAAEFHLTHPSERALSGWMRVKRSGGRELDLFVIVQLYDGETLLSRHGILGPSRRNGPSSISIAAWSAGLSAPAAGGKETAKKGEWAAGPGKIAVPPMLRKPAEAGIIPVRRLVL